MCRGRTDGDQDGLMGGEPVDPDDADVTEAARSALIVNLLTEDNLPSYHFEIATAYRLNLTGPLTNKSSFILMLSERPKRSSSAINATILNNNLQVESYKQTFPTPKLSNSIDLSINYDPKDKHKLFFNYRYQISQGKGGVGGFSLPDSLVENKGQNHSFSISHQYLANANLTSKTIFSIDYSKDNSLTSSNNPALIVLDSFSSGNPSNNGSSKNYKTRFSNDTWNSKLEKTTFNTDLK